VAAIDTDIKDIARTIWATLFELPLEDGDSAQLGPESTVTSCVQIDGAWHGAVVLQCPLTLARTLTAAMFQADTAPELDEVHDALGELTNMLGGNVKALLPGPSRISLPAVAVGSDYHMSVVGTNAVTSLSFTCDGHPLRVTLLQQSGQADPVGK
jgi:CheY-specific phosphatase CheX